ncbi:MAG: hypothetical protein Q7Q71_15365 [Verrucomicrobiota bacterium JB023]|nr:hypothetical protein [Verrucomicrobiota bacterium JB023]
MRTRFHGWLSLGFLWSFMLVAAGQDKPVELRYKPLELTESLFAPSSMLAQERDDYASNLARVAIEKANADQSDESLFEARKLLALALQLSPRNRTANVANHQMGRGILPERKEADYSDAVFARLLLTRAKLLKESGEPVDALLAQCFTEVAASLDPRNEDAVYRFEMLRLDGGEVDWDHLMGG